MDASEDDDNDESFDDSEFRAALGEYGYWMKSDARKAVYKANLYNVYDSWRA